MESIPQRQGGFSGWNRICFAIFKPKWENLGVSAEPTGREETEDALRFLEGFWPAFDFEWVKGYEGVMLPGERIFIGRWLDMRAVDDRGPFIFWDI